MALTGTTALVVVLTGMLLVDGWPAGATSAKLPSKLPALRPSRGGPMPGVEHRVFSMPDEHPGP